MDGGIDGRTNGHCILYLKITYITLYLYKVVIYYLIIIIFGKIVEGFVAEVVTFNTFCKLFFLVLVPLYLLKNYINNIPCIF